MPEDFSVSILAQTSENFQKLFDLSTRIDERVKQIQSRQEGMDERMDEVFKQQVALMQKIAVLESKQEDEAEIVKKVDGIQVSLHDLDKRLEAVEKESGKHSDRWNKVATFIIQLAWVILAAYLLTKLHLQAPAVP
jgi:uncharacterized protein YdcH (DUF465 family)